MGQTDFSPDEQNAAAAERRAIDASTRGPVLWFLVSATFWLLAGSTFGLLTAIKFTHPDFLSGTLPLSFGPLRMAHLSVVAYGWMSMAGVAVAVWLMCRLSRAELLNPGLLKIACVIWNIGVLAGLSGISHGKGTSVEWLDFPVYAPPFLIAALGMIVAWTVATFARRRESHIYVSQWYILGALFWMPWLYTVANFMIAWVPATGVVQAGTNWWFAHNVLGLWLTPIGLGAAYYFIPKVIGRPIYSYHLSLVGFWTLALFYSWAGMHHLIGGPIPAWLATASVAGSIMMFVPVIAVAVNHHLTMVGYFRVLRYSPTLRFVVFGSISYTLTSLQGSVEALKDVNQITHFTDYTVGHAHLGVYAFFSMVMFGSIYYIVPRLTGREWASPKLIAVHFWSCALGITVYFVALTIGGWFQGLMLNDPTVLFADIVKYLEPYRFARTIGGSFMTVGHIVFAFLLALNVLGWSRPAMGQRQFTDTKAHEAAPVEIPV